MRAENRIVHGLWIGRKLSRLELLTLRSFIKHGHEFHLWTYEPLESEVPGGIILEDANLILPKTRIFRYKHGVATASFPEGKGFGKGSLAGFSDLFRFKLLFEKGNWWSDMDITCLRPLDFEQPYVFRPHHRLATVGNLIKCPARSKLMSICYERASREIDENNKEWHRPTSILIKTIQKLGLERFIHGEISNGDDLNEIERYLSDPIPLPSEFHVFHWCNEYLHFRGLEKNRPLEGSTYSMLLEQYKVPEIE